MTLLGPLRSLNRSQRHVFVASLAGWSLDAAAMAEINRILRDLITDPVGPEFMAPPARETSNGR